MTHPLKRFHFRKARVREKVIGTTERPRLSVYRSSKYIYAQIIDDSVGKTLAAASSIESKIKGKNKSACNISFAKKVGQSIAEKSKNLKITRVVFDRGGRVYHGNVKALADSAREHGLEF